LVKKLIGDGHKVRAMVIENDPLIDSIKDLSCEIVTGDITKKETLIPSMNGVKTVFHLAAVLVANDLKLFRVMNYEGTKDVIGAAVEAGVEHFINLSAAAAGYKTRTTYGDSKLESESLMKEKRNNTNFTIIRPTLLYGAGGSQELKIYVQALRKVPFVVPVIGMGKAKKCPVWVGDIVKGLSLLVNKPISYGKTYDFGGATELSMWDYTKKICETFDIHKPMVPVPAGLCFWLASILKVFMKKPLLRRDTILGVIMDANGNIELARKEISYDPVKLDEGYALGFASEEDKF